MTKAKPVWKRAYVGREKEYGKEYRAKNADKIKAYYARNADKISQRGKEYRMENAPVINERRKRYRAASHSQIKEYNLRAKYGISPQQYRDMIDAQLGMCAICADIMQPGPGTHLDHCHATGKLRQMLCSKCNVGIGFFRDNSGLLRDAADYLDRHNEK